jgi:glycosyltransferase involved in cell wall biosynthesis
LAFLGRISPEKGVDRAIKVAQTLGIPLKIAAKVDRTDEVYFREQITPLLKGPGVQFIGEIDEQQKSDFLGQALALMFLIDWPEPFGLSMIEAMACGTPVLALRRGSVEEVVEDGLTGHIIDSIEEATVALPRVMALDRRAVRRRFEEHFSATRMTNDYVRLYKTMLSHSTCRGQCRPQHLDRRARQPHWATRGSDRRRTHDRPVTRWRCWTVDQIRTRVSRLLLWATTSKQART